MGCSSLTNLGVSQVDFPRKTSPGNSHLCCLISSHSMSPDQPVLTHEPSNVLVQRCEQRMRAARSRKPFGEPWNSCMRSSFVPRCFAPREAAQRSGSLVQLDGSSGPASWVGSKWAGWGYTLAVPNLEAIKSLVLVQVNLPVLIQNDSKTPLKRWKRPATFWKSEDFHRAQHL